MPPENVHHHYLTKDVNYISLYVSLGQCRQRNAEIYPSKFNLKPQSFQYQTSNCWTTTLLDKTNQTQPILFGGNVKKSKQNIASQSCLVILLLIA